MSEPAGGTAQPVRVLGDPVLRARCATVSDFGPALEQLVSDMFATMYAADGVGLAANQIGVALRVFVFDCPDDGGRQLRGAVVNPTLEMPAPGQRRLSDDEEGCLSVPGGYAPIARPSDAVVHGVDPKGDAVRVEGTGFLARCLQHECDHLDGRVFVDRLSARDRRALLRSAGLADRADRADRA
ncbi:MAG: peptide deformylase [Carbonactinosporaceae bacterium]